MSRGAVKGAAGTHLGSTRGCRAWRAGGIGGKPRADNLLQTGRPELRDGSSPWVSCRSCAIPSSSSQAPHPGAGEAESFPPASHNEDRGPQPHLAVKGSAPTPISREIPLVARERCVPQTTGRPRISVISGGQSTFSRKRKQQGQAKQLLKNPRLQRQQISLTHKRKVECRKCCSVKLKAFGTQTRLNRLVPVRRS